LHRVGAALKTGQTDYFLVSDASAFQAAAEKHDHRANMHPNKQTNRRCQAPYTTL
jgi:hypothetical protein